MQDFALPLINGRCSVFSFLGYLQLGVMEVPTEGEEVKAARPLAVLPQIWAKEETSTLDGQQTRME